MTFTVFGYFSDVDECNDDTADCPSNSICINTRGSFECPCERGYTMTGEACVGMYNRNVTSLSTVSVE